MLDGEAKNIFVLSTGRTATTAFATASSFIPGYTAAHESRSTKPFAERLDYAPNHIEADNRLIFFLAHIEEKFGDDAYYVQLVRSPSEVSKSYSDRWHLSVSIVRAWTHGMRMIPRIKESEIEGCCRDFVDWANSTLEIFLAKQKNVFRFDVSNAEAEYLRFLTWIGVGDPPPEAVAQWKKRHNKNAKNASTYIRKKLRLFLQ